MKKQKGMIITAAVLLAAAAVVTGSRLIRHPEKSNTKKSEVADQENSEKEQDHRTSGTELSEKKQNMNEPDHTQKEQSVENADRTGKSITEEAFYISKIPDDIFEKMQGKSYKADCTVPREDLRYLHVLHMGFDGQTKEGELVVNKAIAEDVLAIFRQLYEAEYPIEKVRLVDCNLLEYLTQRDIQTKNSGVNVRYRGKHRFFKGFNEFIKEKTRRCDNDFEKIERHVFF